jgi:uncharacterized protein (DUF2132 family)
MSLSKRITRKEGDPTPANKPQITQANNPLHGVKLADLLDILVETYGWEEMGRRVNIRCFQDNPTKKSSLKFLRTTPWAREKVENLYVRYVENSQSSDPE